MQWSTPRLKDNFPHQERCVVGSAWFLQKKPITRHLPEKSRHRYLPDIVGARYNPAKNFGIFVFEIRAQKKCYFYSNAHFYSQYAFVCVYMCVMFCYRAESSISKQFCKLNIKAVIIQTQYVIVYRTKWARVSVSLKISNGYIFTSYNALNYFWNRVNLLKYPCQLDVHACISAVIVYICTTLDDLKRKG